MNIERRRTARPQLTRPDRSQPTSQPHDSAEETAITFQIHVNKHNKNRAIINLNRVF